MECCRCSPEEYVTAYDGSGENVIFLFDQISWCQCNMDVKPSGFPESYFSRTREQQASHHHGEALHVIFDVMPVLHEEAPA